MAGRGVKGRKRGPNDGSESDGVGGGATKKTAAARSSAKVAVKDTAATGSMKANNFSVRSTHNHIIFDHAWADSILTVWASQHEV